MIEVPSRCRSPLAMLGAKWAACSRANRYPIACLVLLLLGATAFSQESAVVAEDGSNLGRAAAAKSFDIPSQALEDALYAFDAATGIEVVVDGPTVAGHRSTAIKGVFTPVQALRSLLAGTGLDAKLIGANAITLLPGGLEKRTNSSVYRDYSALVQTAIVRTLCATADTRPGDYRIAIQLWLGPAGIISTADLLSSTGDAVRDQRLRSVLAGTSVGKAPPPTLPQPIVMVILPRSPQDSGDCR